MSSHSIISPSASGVWKHCPGYVTAAQLFPDLSGTLESDEGEASHWAAQYKLNGARKDCTNVTAPNGVVIDKEMDAGAQMFYEYVYPKIKDLADTCFGIEQRFFIPSIHELCFGTPDVWAVCGGTLEVVDYKYGFLPVEAFENPQLICYASGLLDHLGINGHYDQQFRVKFTVMQPRDYVTGRKVKEWEVQASELRPYITQLRNAAEEALSQSPTYRSGPHCRYCPARANCGPAIQAATQLFEASSQALPVALDPAQKGRLLDLVLRAEEQITAIKTSLEAEIPRDIRNGAIVPGWAVEPRESRLKWTNTAEFIADVGDIMGINLRKPMDVVTPTQAAKEKNAPQEFIDSFAKRQPTGYTLVKSTPPRGLL